MTLGHPSEQRIFSTWSTLVSFLVKWDYFVLWKVVYFTLRYYLVAFTFTLLHLDCYCIIIIIIIIIIICIIIIIIIIILICIIICINYLYYYYYYYLYYYYYYYYYTIIKIIKCFERLFDPVRPSRWYSCSKRLRKNLFGR